jgi:hypothetical protein
VDAETERLLERGAVLLQPEGPARLTEYGKRYFDQKLTWIHAFGDVWRDVARLTDIQLGRWGEVLARLKVSEDPVMTSGLTINGMQKLLDHIVGKTSFPVPTTVALGLGTAAPTSATTGVWANECTAGGYVTYARASTTEATWTNAATAADPSVVTNAGIITFAACTGAGATLLGFIIADNDTLNTGASFFYGPLTSTVISTTQTPPTIAAGAMSLSLTGT